MPLIWDNHACIPLRPDSQSIPAQLERYRASGVDIVSLNICWDGVSPDLALPMAEAFRACVAKHPDRYLLVETVDDLERARASSRLGIVFDVEGGRALKGDVAMVARFHALGVRWMLLTYNRRNELGGGCLDADNGGLTDFGRAVLDEMCRVGIVPCCSHVSERAAKEVMERSTLPVIFSHSNARAGYAQLIASACPLRPSSSNPASGSLHSRASFATGPRGAVRRSRARSTRQS
jgi:membrane dipeptidase